MESSLEGRHYPSSAPILNEPSGSILSARQATLNNIKSNTGIVNQYDKNPFIEMLALSAAGLGGKALMRSSRRAAARRLADGIVKTPVNINPVFANGLSAPALNALSKYQNRQDY